MEKDDRKRPIIIIDGLNCFIRFFMVNESMSGYSEPVGGVVGFLKFLDNLLYRFSPGKVIVVWENGGPSPRRKQICPTYKEGRSKFLKTMSSEESVKSNKKERTLLTIKDSLRTDSDNKVKQLGLLYKLLKNTPINQIFIKETECDDIIGYLIKYEFANENRLKLIASSDKDFFQLLKDPDVKIYDPAKKLVLDETFVLKKYGISTNNFCLARTMDGDPSDNLPGVSGVGLKTIAKQFPGFAEPTTDMTIDGLLAECKALSQNRKKPLKSIQGILDSEEIIRKNWKLMYLTSSNLSAHHIEKIKGSLETQEDLKFDKLGLIKEVAKSGLNMSFDFDRFSSSIRQCLIFE